MNDNHSLNQEKHDVESSEGRWPASDRQWLFRDADFAAIAESMGAMELTLDKPGDLQGALDKAFAADRPAVWTSRATWTAPRRGLAARVGRGGVRPPYCGRGCVARPAGIGSRL